MAKRKTESIVPVERIRDCIYMIRGQTVLLSFDIARLYGVPAKVLIQAVKRNIERFPEDFMFQLSREEQENLKSQIVTSSWGGRRRSFPYAFTEQGVAMLSSVLRSQRAVEVNIAIMRTFVQLRKILADNSLLRHKIESLECKYDEQFQQVFAVLEQMLIDDPEDKKQIGYHTEADKSKAIK